MANPDEHQLTISARDLLKAIIDKGTYDEATETYVVTFSKQAWWKLMEIAYGTEGAKQP